MCAPALIPIVSAVIGAGTAVYSSNRMQKEQDKQRREQEELARRQAATRSSMEGQQVNIEEGAIAPSGIGNTFLTGAGGVSNDQLNLSGNTKLGG